jgi:hypothetical protein
MGSGNVAVKVTACPSSDGLDDERDCCRLIQRSASNMPDENVVAPEGGKSGVKVKYTEETQCVLTNSPKASLRQSLLLFG